MDGKVTTSIVPKHTYGIIFLVLCYGLTLEAQGGGSFGTSIYIFHSHFLTIIANSCR